MDWAIFDPNFTGDFLKNKALLPVVASDTCVAGHPLKQRVFIWRVIQSYTWILTTILCAGFFGAILSQRIMFAQYHTQKEVDDAVERRQQEWKIEDLTKEVAALRVVHTADEVRITELEHNQYVMNGIGLAFVGAVGFITFIRMIAGKKIKDGT